VVLVDSVVGARAVAEPVEAGSGSLAVKASGATGVLARPWRTSTGKALVLHLQAVEAKE
jgi:hypothetical protein